MKATLVGDECYRDQSEYDDEHNALFIRREFKNLEQAFNHFTYRMGSFILASRNPVSRRRQESHWPQARPSVVGS